MIFKIDNLNLFKYKFLFVFIYWIFTTNLCNYDYDELNDNFFLFRLLL